jgi:hypothetical protein
MLVLVACGGSGSARQSAEEYYTIKAGDVLNGNVVTLFNSSVPFDDRGKDDLYTITITDVSFISVDEIREETNGSSQSESESYRFQGLENGLIRVEYLIDNPTGYDINLYFPFVPFDLYQITNTNYEKPYEQGEFSLHSFNGVFDGDGNLDDQYDEDSGYYLPYIEYEDGSKERLYSVGKIRPKEKATVTEYFSLNEKDSNADIDLVLQAGVLDSAIGYEVTRGVGVPKRFELMEQGKYPKDFFDSSVLAISRRSYALRDI